MGLLSTHVLDTMRGRPAPGVQLELYAVAPDNTRTLLVRTSTNADGRTDAALLDESSFKPGCYEIVFHLGDYFRAAGAPVAEPPFFNLVPIRFDLIDPDYHYHVPVVASPWTYSTYRGNPASKVS
jgi:5-hydroxyisourate hydrolase